MLAAAFVANALLIEPLGWPISGAILFWGSAFALGSRHYLRDAVIALVLSFGSWYLFAFGLGVGPAGRHPEGHPLMDALTSLIEGFGTALTPDEPAVRLRSACCSAPRSACCPASARP